MKKTILITWWTGYIGSHWVVAFEQAWYKTVIVDNLCNSSIDTLDWIEKIIGYKPDFYEVDLRDKEWLEEVFKKYSFDWVIHFAGLKSPSESQESSIYYFQNNISWSINLFEIMDKYSVKNIVFSSSANTYSTSNIPPINESCTQSTTNPYWTTKLVLEQILNDLAEFNLFKVVNLRYFNPIWAHTSWNLWEDPEWIPNNLLPYIMKVATWEYECVNVFWDDYDTIDWTWIRDYIDVNDLISAHILAYNKISELSDDKWYSNNYNVWVGRWISVLEAINATELVLWKKINYKIVDRRSWDIPVSFCDVTKIQNELWWKAEISLDDSLKNSWRFYGKKI